MIFFFLNEKLFWQPQLKHCLLSCIKDPEESVCLPNRSVKLKSNSKWSGSSFYGKRPVTNDCSTKVPPQFQSSLRPAIDGVSYGRMKKEVNGKMWAPCLQTLHCCFSHPGVLGRPYQLQCCGRVAHLTLQWTLLMSSVPPLPTSPSSALRLALRVSTSAHKATSNMPCTFYLYEDEALVGVFDLGTKGSLFEKKKAAENRSDV